MYDRFTDRAKTSMLNARKLAEATCEGVIKPSHILLGIVKEGTGTGAKALLASPLFEKLCSVCFVDSGIVPSGGRHMDFEFSDSSRLVLEEAINEARRLGRPDSIQQFVATEHLVLALMKTQDFGVVTSGIVDSINETLTGQKAERKFEITETEANALVAALGAESWFSDLVSRLKKFVK